MLRAVARMECAFVAAHFLHALMPRTYVEIIAETQHTEIYLSNKLFSSFAMLL